MNGNSAEYDFVFHKRLYLNQRQWDLVNSSDEFKIEEGLIYFLKKQYSNNGNYTRKTLIAINSKLLTCITARNEANENDNKKVCRLEELYTGI